MGKILLALEGLRNGLYVDMEEVAVSFEDVDGKAHPAIAFVGESGIQVFTPADSDAEGTPLFAHEGFIKAEHLAEGCQYTRLVRPSCFHCKNLISWDQEGTIHSAPDSGWDCVTLPQDEYLDLMDRAKEVDAQTEQEEAQAIGTGCRLFEFFDWNLYYAEQADELVAEASS